MGSICGGVKPEQLIIPKGCELMGRPFMEKMIFYEDGCKVNVLHWNVLAQKQTAKENFPNVCSSVMTWEHRRELFRQEFFKS